MGSQPQFWVLKAQRALLTTLPLALLLWGCGEAIFKHDDRKRDGADAGRIDQDGLTNEAAHSLTFAAEELLPFELKFSEANVTFNEAGLPPGAVFDQAANILRWIPKKGQNGVYNFGYVSASSSAATDIRIEVEERPEEAMHQGPPAAYLDGDIGYIYVHGLATSDLCATPGFPDAYWGKTPDVLTPDAKTRKLACYDGRAEIAKSAVSVAEQILAADCGLFSRCVVFTHSMGGLVTEFILTHADKAPEGHPHPEHFKDQALFEKVRERVLFVVSITSAAGGSRAANIFVEPEKYPSGARAVGYLAQFFQAADASVRDLMTSNAAVLAPLNVDPGVPFFMVPGYSHKQLDSLGQVASVNGSIFNGSHKFAFVDKVVEFPSRSDGLVSFRSACGVASAKEDDGPGYGAALEEHLKYCFEAAKKPRHYVWFATNLNHSLMVSPYAACSDAANPCLPRFPDPAKGTLSVSESQSKKDAVSIMRQLLTKDAGLNPHRENSAGANLLSLENVKSIPIHTFR